MEISLQAIKKPLQQTIKRYHAVIFSVLILGGLVFIVLTLNNIIISSGTSTDYTPTGSTTTFDQKTIDRVNSLKARGEAPAELDLSGGRVNPFIE